jgi:hypothetical protein
MDPLSITAATSSLVFQIVKNGKALADIYEKYKDAQRCIFMMQTECTVLAAALSRVEIVFHARSKSTVQDYPASLLQALDLSLVGCTLTLSILSREIDNLTKGSYGEGVAVKKMKRARYVWSEASMNDLLLQLRAQSSAIALLLEALNNSSIDRILAILESGQPTFRRVAEDAASIRSANPEERYAESICDLPLSNDADGDSRSIYTLLGRDRSPDLTQGLTDRRRLTSAPEGNPWGPQSSRAESEFIKSLDNFRAKMKAPALAVGILSAEGSSVYVRGIRKQGCPTPVARVDRFFITGLVYTMIPTLLAVLIEKGVFNWSTTVVEALPEVAQSIHADYRRLTLEMLCAHVSGIVITGKDLRENMLRASTQQNRGVEERKALAMVVLADRPGGVPGKKYHLTIVNLLILISILEERTARPIEDLLKAELFDPLEMYHTGWYNGQDQTIIALDSPTQPWYHCLSEDTGQVVPCDLLDVRKLGPALRPIIHLLSSLPDMMVWLNLHLQGTLGLPAPLLTAASFEKLLTPLHGENIVPGAWNAVENKLFNATADGKSSNYMLINRDKREAYVYVANIGASKPDFEKAMDEFRVLCESRSRDLPFQNRNL